MRLAFCLFKYFPYGGLSNDFLRILRECQRRDHDISVFVSDWEGPRPDGVELTVLKTYRRSNHAQNSSFYRQLKTKLAKQHFDAIVGFNKMPGLDIYYAADFCYVGRVAPSYPWWYRLTTRYRRMAAFEHAVFGPGTSTKILSLSTREQGVYRQYYSTVDERFHTLSPTLDHNRRLVEKRDDARARIRAEFVSSEEERLVLFIGSGFRTKGLDRAIRALASLPEELARNARLLVIGQDVARSFVRLAKRLGIRERVKFLGGRSDVPQLLAAGDVLLHPAYNENTGTVILEAIASGLPVLTTDVCGYASHVVEAEAGVVAQSPFVQADIDAALCHMLTSPDADDWRRNGLAYGSNPDLYTMPGDAVDQIEHWANEENAAAIDVSAATEQDLIYVRKDIQPQLANMHDVKSFLSLDGVCYRDAPGRRTIRIESNGSAYFLKGHTGVGWFEIVKNLSYGRLPVIGAANEWHGIHWVTRLGLDTLRIAGYGADTGSPATRHSFIMTDEIKDAISLEDYFVHADSDATRAWHRRWRENASVAENVRFKRRLIQRVADIARKMHASGANHRDFYLCHFLLPPPTAADVAPVLHLIDLHRMQIRRKTPTRWVLKDISGLFYSCLDAEFGPRDYYRFIKHYRSKPLREVLEREREFWQKVDAKARALYVAEARRAERLVESDAVVPTETV